MSSGFEYKENCYGNIADHIVYQLKDLYTDWTNTGHCRDRIKSGEIAMRFSQAFRFFDHIQNTKIGK